MCIRDRSCCEKAAEAEPEFIIDPDDAPPDVYEGEPRYVADPADTAPAAWDEDEDGPYERRLIENPRYAWAPREIENPRYRPPALGERYADEVRAAASVPRESVGGPIEALVTAVQGSQASALNAELVKAKDANAVLALTSARDAESMNTVNVVTALHRLASIEKRRRAERESTLRDPAGCRGPHGTIANDDGRLKCERA